MGNNGHDFSGTKNPNYRSGLLCDPLLKGIHNSWMNMKQRCSNPAHPKYHRYGGRGVKVHESWLDVIVFKEWAIANGWVKGYHLDRIDNNGNYSPDNCQWLSPSASSRKKSTTKLSIQQAEEIRCKSEKGESVETLSKEYGVTEGNIWFVTKGYTHVADGVCSQKLKERKT